MQFFFRRRRTLPSVRAHSSRIAENLFYGLSRLREIAAVYSSGFLRRHQVPVGRVSARCFCLKNLFFHPGTFVKRLHRGAVQAREFQRRADRTLFRSRRASQGCFQFLPVVFLYIRVCHFAKAILTAITPLSTLIGSSGT